MNITLRERDGTPVQVVNGGIVELEMKQRLSDGTYVRRSIRVWVDRDDDKTLKMDADAPLLMQLVRENRAAFTFPQQDT